MNAPRSVDDEADLLDAMVRCIEHEPLRYTHADIKAEVLDILDLLLDDPTRDITSDEIVTLCCSSCPQVRDLGLRLSSTLPEAAR